MNSGGIGLPKPGCYRQDIGPWQRSDRVVACIGPPDWQLFKIEPGIRVYRGRCGMQERRYTGRAVASLLLRFAQSSYQLM